jgi:hypothetical protein
MTVLFVRFVGIVACFFSSWQLGLLALALLLFVGKEGMPGGVIKFTSSGPRIFVEIAALAIGLYGIWAFPHVSPEMANTTAVVCGLAVLAHFANVYSRNNRYF